MSEKTKAIETSEANDKVQINREHKDRLFKFIFGNEEHKEWTLSLYNAVNGSNYTDKDEIKFNTIENVVYMSMKNDLSFLVGNSISFYEQQSTYNPNMPVRFLIYSGMVYAKHITDKGEIHLYSQSRQKVPAPKCICFYNGRDDKEDKIILRFSDMFEKQEDSDIEVKVTMLNINYGHNKELLNACKPLQEYSLLVDNIRTFEEEYTLEEAVDKAIDELPEESVIKPFLLSNRAEVKRMCLTEYDEARIMAEQRQDGYDEGKKDGYENGQKDGYNNGESRSFKLIARLTKEKRYEDILIAEKDKEYREKLYKEFGI